MKGISAALRARKFTSAHGVLMPTNDNTWGVSEPALYAWGVLLLFSVLLLSTSVARDLTLRPFTMSLALTAATAATEIAGEPVSRTIFGLAKMISDSAKVELL